MTVRPPRRRAAIAGPAAVPAGRATRLTLGWLMPCRDPHDRLCRVHAVAPLHRARTGATREGEGAALLVLSGTMCLWICWRAATLPRPGGAGCAGIWTAPGSLEAVTSGKVGAHGIQEAASC